MYLQDLRTNINAIAKSSTIKDNFSKIVLQYLDAKIGIILQYPTTSITSFSTSGTGSTTTDNTSTGSISSTGSTSSTGVVAERVSGDKLTKEQYERLIDGTYFLLTNNANFSFMEYIDLECPSCAKLHND
ncbi:MAG: hypothetical protein LBD88_02810 [Candidatus Peribacteria bacterium]|nr:hypothetical protein [Candidatus Peribacteria bacterium]